nr:PREDICTED: PR domain zinc finger protein 10-like isoform X2 [Bemisia tabaci]
MAGSCGPMVGGGQTMKIDKCLVPPLELWPPTSNSSAVDDKAASQLLFLTVEYVEEGAAVPSNASLFDPAVSESLPQYQPRVSSPLVSNLDSMARYSPLPPVSKPEGASIGSMGESSFSDSFAVSVSGALDVFQTPPTTTGESTQEQNTQLIIMDTFYQQRGTQLTDLEPSHVEDFSNPEYILPILPEASDKLLLDPASLNSSELLISVEDAASIFPTSKSNGRIELLLSNGNIAYGLIDSMPTSRVLQIPKEYLINSGRFSLDEAALESDADLKSILVEKSHDPKWNQSSSLDSSSFSVDSRTDLLDGSLLKESSATLNDDNLSDVLSKNISLDNIERDKNLGGSPSDADLGVDTSSFWCEECNCFYETECIKHQFQTIYDKPVVSRARATLPATYLFMNELKADKQSSRKESIMGVFARKHIPKRTQFGPVEGNFLTTPSDEKSSGSLKNFLKFSIEVSPEKFIDVDVSDDEASNWMKFVRPADSSRNQNLRLCQQGKALFFITTKEILPKQELRVWYSYLYAVKRNLPNLSSEGTADNREDLTEENDQLFSNFDSDEGLTKDEESAETSNSKFLRKKKNKGVKSKLVGLSNQEFACDSCDLKFRRYSRLMQHLSSHKKSDSRKNIKEHSKEIPLSRIPKKKESSERLDSDKENKSELTTDKLGPGTKKQCNKCCLVFPNEVLYEMHTISHSISKKDDTSGALWVCPQCHEECKSRQELSEHVATHCVPWNGTIPYYCVRCDKTLANADRWKRHEAIHKSEDSKPFGCSFCIRRFFSHSALVCHMNYHDTTDKTFDCPICKASFPKITPLKAHIHQHRSNGVYKCPHCPKEYEQYTLIRKHIRSFHSEPKLVCSVCNKAFRTPDKLRLHSLRHSDHREFLCSQCGRQFKRKDKLKAHMDHVHSAAACEKSKGRFIKTASKPANGAKKFAPKLVVNTADYNRYFYKCHSCMVGFKRRGMLVNHLANRHPEISPDSVPELSLPILKTRRNYYCQYCDKIYKSSSKRKVHILKNHPGLELPSSNRLRAGSVNANQVPNASYSRTVESVTSNPHSCPWCHKQYASKAKLLQHQRNKHKELVKISSKQETKQPKDVSKPVFDLEKGRSEILPKTNCAAAEVETTREDLADLTNSCNLATTETELTESHETRNVASLKCELKDLSSADWLNHAFAALGPAISDLITYVTDSNGQQTCTLNLTQEQYSKVMEQKLPLASPSPSSSLAPMPLTSNSPVTTLNSSVSVESGISQSYGLPFFD